MNRPFYNSALASLQAAHDACMKAPDRGPGGMSSGPFAGVNEALGIVCQLEDANLIAAEVIRAQQLEIATLRNAALIVEAVNSYDAMKARIAELEGAVVGVSRAWASDSASGDMDTIEAAVRRAEHILHAPLRQILGEALAKATS